MDPKQNKKRQVTPGGRYVDTVAMSNQDEDIFGTSSDNTFDDVSSDVFSQMYPNNDSAFESFNIDVNPNMTGEDEELRIEAIKQATSIARLMSNVKVADVLRIAEQVYAYLK